MKPWNGSAGRDSSPLQQQASMTILIIAIIACSANRGLASQELPTTTTRTPVLKVSQPGPTNTALSKSNRAVDPSEDGSSIAATQIIHAIKSFAAGRDQEETRNFNETGQLIDGDGSPQEIDAIYKNIEALRRALEMEKKRRDKQPAPSEPTQQTQSPAQSTPIQIADATEQPDNENGQSDNPSRPQTEAIDNDEQQPRGVRVIPQPVNSFELANSLFATGNYSQAIKSYEALMADDHPSEDQNWLRLLMAACYRIEGETMKAESLYREIMSSRESPEIKEYSKWFLEHLALRQRLEQQLYSIESHLNDVAEEN
jgi:tetratricopeptide (TPR) repeat protein